MTLTKFASQTDMGICALDLPEGGGSTSCFCQDTDTEQRKRRKERKDCCRAGQKMRMTSNEVTAQLGLVRAWDIAHFA